MILKQQTPRAAREVLATPYCLDVRISSPPIWRICLAPPVNVDRGQEPPAPRPVISREPQTLPVQANEPPDPVLDEGPARARSRLGPVSQRERETPNCFPGDVYDTHPAFAHETMGTAAFDAIPKSTARTTLLCSSGSPPFFALRNESLLLPFYG